MSNPKKENKNNLLIIILLIIVVVIVLFFPPIYKYIEGLKLPKLSPSEEKKVEEKIEVEEEVLESLHYPIMRSSIYSSDTYYTLDKFSISNMSNSDILYNAFMDMYEGNMTDLSTKGKCTATSKQFNKDYIELRIKNILGKNVSYTLGNFYVPEDSNTKYAGEWIYDNSNSRFVYNGLCNSLKSNITYYNLSQFIKAEYSGKDVITYYYVGFAKVEGKNYTLYSDAKMGNVLSTGTIDDSSNLDELYKELPNKNKKIYKYIFKNSLCSYNEYCLYEGEWIDEL